MLLILLLIIPLIGTILVSTNSNIVGLASNSTTSLALSTNTGHSVVNQESTGQSLLKDSNLAYKQIGLLTSIVNLFVSIIVFLLFNFSSNQYQFVQEYHSISNFDFYLGVDGISIYFILLTTLIMPIAILSN